MYPNTKETTSSSPAELTSIQVDGKAVAPSRPRKFQLIRTLLLTLALLAGIGGVLVFSVLMSRPTWHTVLGEGKPGSLVVAMDYPDTWKRMETYSATAPRRSMNPNVIQLKRQAPTGLLGWWTRTVLHQDDNDIYAPQIMVMGESYGNFPRQPNFKNNATRIAQGIQLLDSVQNNAIGALKSRPGYKVTMQRVQHPLGPALHITYTIDTTLLPGTNKSKLTGKHVVDYWYIVPLKTPADSTNYIMISCFSPATEAPSLKALYAEVIQRVHFVKKP